MEAVASAARLFAPEAVFTDLHPHLVSLPVEPLLTLLAGEWDEVGAAAVVVLGDITPEVWMEQRMRNRWFLL